MGIKETDWKAFLDQISADIDQDKSIKLGEGDEQISFDYQSDEKKLSIQGNRGKPVLIDIPRDSKLSLRGHKATTDHVQKAISDIENPGMARSIKQASRKAEKSIGDTRYLEATLSSMHGAQPGSEDISASLSTSASTASSPSSSRPITPRDPRDPNEDLGQAISDWQSDDDADQEKTFNVSVSNGTQVKVKIKSFYTTEE